MNIINEIPIGSQHPAYKSGDVVIYYDSVEVRVYDQEDTARVVARWSHSFAGPGDRVYKPAEGDSRRYAVRVKVQGYWRRGLTEEATKEETSLEYLHDGGQSITVRAVPLPGTEAPRLNVTSALDGAPSLFAGGGTLYRINAQGNLLRYQHDANGVFADYSGREIGSGWGGMLHIAAVRDGGLYAVDASRRLRYYHHDAAGNWDDGNGRVIGEGWGFPWVGAGRFGQLYVINSARQLLYYEHDASFHFGARSGVVLGDGWPDHGVFGGGTNCVYLIGANGDLLHYYHNDALAWEHTQLKIGAGWGGFTRAGSGGNGEIYAVNPDGDLLFYRHDANHRFLAGSGRTIGWGWKSGSRYAIIPSAR